MTKQTQTSTKTTWNVETYTNFGGWRVFVSGKSKSDACRIARGCLNKSRVVKSS